MYAGLRAKGDKPDLALVTCDVDATSAGKLVMKTFLYLTAALISLENVFLPFHINYF